jgi:hypothetical protein
MIDRPTLGLGKSSYRVFESTHTELPPIALAIHAGPMSFQEYFTPEEAKRLGLMLLEAADRAGVEA